MKYQIVSSRYVIELEDKVNDLMAEGWLPRGGVSIINEPAYTPMFYQAMMGPSRVWKVRKLTKRVIKAK